MNLATDISFVKREGVVFQNRERAVRAVILGGAIAITLGMLAMSGCTRYAKQNREDRIQTTVITHMIAWYTDPDQACVEYLALRLLEKVVSYPNVFYARMDKDTALYTRYLESLSTQVFSTWEDTTVAHLEERRLNTIRQLEICSVDPKYLNLNRRMIETLQGIHVLLRK